MKSFSAPRRAILCQAGLLLGAAAALSPKAARAQERVADFPSRPVRIILPFAAGGPSDIMTRYLAQQLSELWKQPVVVDNRPGAGGVIGTEMLAKAPADGYTIGIGSVGSHAINATLFAKLPYDPIGDFAAITLLASYPTMLAVHPSVPANSVKELVALLKSNPDKYSFASAGLGSSAHLVGEMFKLATSTKMTHVPYKGDAPALNDLVAGQTQVMFTNLTATAMGFVQSGRIRALAVTSPERTPFAPGVPALAEAIPGFQARTWVGIFAPGKTPPEIVAKINGDIARLMQTQAVRNRFHEFGAGMGGNSPAEFAAYVKSEVELWRPVVVASGAKAE